MKQRIHTYIYTHICTYTYIYIYAIKYWLQGDDWKFAKEYAKAIVRGFEGTLERKKGK